MKPLFIATQILYVHFSLSLYLFLAPQVTSQYLHSYTSRISLVLHVLFIYLLPMVFCPLFFEYLLYHRLLQYGLSMLFAALAIRMNGAVGGSAKHIRRELLSALARRV